MRHWGQDILLDRRRLIACAAGLVVAHSARAALVATPPQTAGPFYPRVKPKDSDADLTRIGGGQGAAAGEVIEVSGRVLSLKGEPLADAVVEIWQADAKGRYIDERGGASRSDANFQGYGAVRAGADGAYRFRTIRPAAYGSGAFQRTPHIHFRVHGTRAGELVTQMYFPDEPLNSRDFLYMSLAGEAGREAATAILEPGMETPRFLYDLVLA
jgi:protocatechuate 3,4-dioxygenase beta subunit